MDKQEENERQLYLDNLMALAEEDCHGTFKEAIKLRLYGDHEKPVETNKRGNIISPALTSDEYEENQLIVYAYKLLKKANNKEAVNCLREVVVELLKTALSEKNNITYVDELCYLMASLEMEESSELAEDLGKSMWSHLEKFGEFGKLILSDDEELNYIHRTFDVWLTVTSTSQRNEQLQQLFEGSITSVKNISVSAMQFKFLLLIFRALVKFDQYFAGNVAFYKLHEKLVKNLAYISSFNNLCWELGILIRRTEGWLEPFIKGLNEAEISLKNNALKSAIFIDALNRMKLTPSGKIGFVLTFNKIANELISGGAESRVDSKLRILNGDGVTIALATIWEKYSRLFTSLEEILKKFIQQMFMRPPKPFNHNGIYKFSEERDFIEHLYTELIAKQSTDQLRKTSDSSGICGKTEDGKYVCVLFSVSISKKLNLKHEQYANLSEIQDDTLINFSYDNNKPSKNTLYRAA